MSSRLRRSLKSAKRRAQHALGIRRDEVTVISFPKSGRTWLQVMLGEYITRCYGLNVKNVMALKEYTKRLEGVPRIRFAHDERPQWKMSHQLNKNKSEYRDQRVVLRADARATHQSVVTAMDVLGRMGFAELNIATIPPSAGQ